MAFVGHTGTVVLEHIVVGIIVGIALKVVVFDAQGKPVVGNDSS